MHQGVHVVSHKGAHAYKGGVTIKGACNGSHLFPFCLLSQSILISVCMYIVHSSKPVTS